MPTGYTAMLEKRKFDLKSWLLNDVIRAFGCCVMLRDDNADLTVDEIRSRLVESEVRDIEYHKDAISKATAELEVLQHINRSERSRKAFIKKEILKKKSESDKYMKKLVSKKKDYEKTLGRLKELWRHAEGDISNIVKFAVEQVETTIDHDCDIEWYKKYQTRSYSLSKHITEIEDDIKRHEKNMVEDRRRAAERIKFFDEYVAFIEKMLK